MPFSFSSISFTTQCRFFFPLKFTYDCQASRKVRGHREKYLLILHTYGPLSPHTLNLASVSLMFLTPLLLSGIDQLISHLNFSLCSVSSSLTSEIPCAVIIPPLQCTGSAFTSSPQNSKFLSQFQFLNSTPNFSY